MALSKRHLHKAIQALTLSDRALWNVKQALKLSDRGMKKPLQALNLSDRHRLLVIQELKLRNRHHPAVKQALNLSKRRIEELKQELKVRDRHLHKLIQAFTLSNPGCFRIVATGAEELNSLDLTRFRKIIRTKGKQFDLSPNLQTLALNQERIAVYCRSLNCEHWARRPVNSQPGRLRYVGSVGVPPASSGTVPVPSTFVIN